MCMQPPTRPWKCSALQLLTCTTDLYFPVLGPHKSISFLLFLPLKIANPYIPSSCTPSGWAVLARLHVQFVCHKVLGPWLWKGSGLGRYHWCL